MTNTFNLSYHRPMPPTKKKTTATKKTTKPAEELKGYLPRGGAREGAGAPNILGEETERTAFRLPKELHTRIVADCGDGKLSDWWRKAAEHYLARPKT